MRSASSIKNLMDTTLESIRSTIDANTIIGDPIKAENTVVVPISKVTIGFGIGGGEYSRGKVDNRHKELDNVDDSNFAGGSAGAVSLQPVAFVVVENGETRLMSLDHNINMVDNILSVTPRVLEKIQKLKGSNEEVKNNKEY
ncbi:sporulation protein YtfJ [[Clostridium] sordellii]|uniref:GerW family sporulation protein n=1 Tax=Paraclostridium sordellii TaxID=1505 RepID=UPI0005DE4FB3|nr:GerW family sporulation protein [Paeniclostridium sordellii]MDU7965878.1 GerW family sporulation protein [Paeniclostridium sordellii]CEQ22858.1 sporulation protein YtfJ [[Clostridium] sordellii] [Paeniclostridium sordellii]